MKYRKHQHTYIFYSGAVAVGRNNRSFVNRRFGDTHFSLKEVNSYEKYHNLWHALWQRH